MIQDPVFIVGTERSGSNLLRLLLNETPELTIPHPPHLMRDLAPRIARYGDLERTPNFRRLIADAIRLVGLHFAPWPLRLDAQQVLETAPSRTLYAVYAGIYEQYRAHVGKPRWGCKSTFMIHYVPEILAHHRAPRFVHLVRDPRDVAVSSQRSIFCHYNAALVGRLWAREQGLGRAWARALPAEQWFTLRYEDLLRAPENYLRATCAFAGLTYSPELLKFFNRPSATDLAALSQSWKNLRHPILANNAGKYARALSARDLRLVEQATKDVMPEFNYRLENEPERLGQERLPTARVGDHIEEFARQIREEGRALVRDRNALRRWRKKSYLLSLRWRR